MSRDSDRLMQAHGELTDEELLALTPEELEALEPTGSEGHEIIDDPMPVFVLKAKDDLAMIAILAYHHACRQADLWAQAIEVEKAMSEFWAWRAIHPDECKLPDHKHVPVEETP